MSSNVITPAPAAETADALNYPHDGAPQTRLSKPRSPWSDAWRLAGFFDPLRVPSVSHEPVHNSGAEPLLRQRAVAETGMSELWLWAEALGPFGLRATMLPTCDVNGIWGGYAGPGCKTIIPAEAGFKVCACRSSA